ncbi:MAG: 4'-phosphopantetheinyl transferase superfamily protein [Oscillospiraceae bacterium]|nr:4'-phosphopantetheinyl transferase superfamily protein [Oscillospiraceae bacterium]
MDSINTTEMKITILEIKPKLSHNEFSDLLALVSNEKREKVKRFHIESDSQSSLLGDILARIELCGLTGLRNNQLSFSENEYGKPLLTNAKDVHYNISHSGMFVVCAFNSAPVGIDIETIKPIDMAIAKRFFSQDEVDYILYPSDENKLETKVLNHSVGGSAEPSNKYERFYQIWTMKESYIKWEGMGLSKPLNSFCVLNTQPSSPPYYNFIFKNDDVMCYACASIEQKLSVKYEGTAEVIKAASLLHYI